MKYITQSKHRHHINLNPKDNSEDNVVILEKNEHYKVHKGLIKIKQRVTKRLIKSEIIRFDRYQNKYILDEIVWNKIFGYVGNEHLL